MSRLSSGGGFTLIEVIIAIAVISILATMAIPYAAKIIDQTRTETTRQRMMDLHKTIAGDPATGPAGFVGDMGRLPAMDTLTQLNTALAPASSAQYLGVRMGWNGPYINSGFDPTSYYKDAWGTVLRYGHTTSPPVDSAGQIRSAGADRNFGTADDLVYPSIAVVFTGSLLVNLYVWDNAAAAYVLNPQPAAYPGMTAAVTFYYSNNGVQTTGAAGSPAAPPYTFTNFHAGCHAVSATCTLPPRPAGSGQAVANVPGNSQQAQLNLYLR